MSSSNLDEKKPVAPAALAEVAPATKALAPIPEPVAPAPAAAASVVAAAALAPSSAAASPTAPSGEAKYLRPHLRVGDALNGRYEIMHDISTGSFGHVIACKDIKQNGRIVAVKVQDRVEAKYHKGTFDLRWEALLRLIAPSDFRLQD